MAIDTRRFFNPSQPQTLQISVWLLYFNAFWALLSALSGFPLSFLAVAACARIGLRDRQREALGLPARRGRRRARPRAAGLGRGRRAIELVCLVLYLVPRTSVLGALLLTGYLGGAVATHVRVENPLLTHTLFPLYVGAMLWGGLYLRESRLHALLPLRRGDGAMAPASVIAGLPSR